MLITIPCCIIGFPCFAYIYQTYTISPFTIKAEITPDSCNAPGKGIIGLAVSGGTSPYTYLWNTGATTSVISSLTSGIYSVKITDANGAIANASIQLGYYLQWTDVTGITESTGNLTKTATDGWGNAGAASTNILNANQDGYVEFSVSNLNADAYTIGLSTSNKDNNYTSINYGIMYNNQKIYIYENGVKVSLTTVAANNTFRIYREGSNIYYYKNTTLLRTVATNAANTLITDVAIKNTNGKIYNTASSFCMPPVTIASSDTIYAVLKTELDGGYYTAKNGILSFIYFEEYNDQDAKLNYAVYDKRHNLIASSSNYSLNVNYGENKYSISTTDNLKMPVDISRDYYSLEVINEKKEKWMLRFYNDVSCNPCQ